MWRHPQAACGLLHVLGFCLKLNFSGEPAVCRNSPCTSPLLLLAVFSSTGLTRMSVGGIKQEGKGVCI